MRMVSQDGTQVAGQIDGSHQRPVQFSRLEKSDSCFQGTDAGALFVGKGETRPSNAEFTGDAACHHASEGTHCPVGREGWAGRVSQRRGP